MKLYYSRYTRAARPRWVLEEAGAAYELIRVDLKAGDHKQPGYLAVHPHGVVPALDDGGHRIYESVAICMHLSDKFPEAGLAPAPGTPERGWWYQWMLYAVATVEAPIAAYANHTRFLPEDRRVAAVAEDAQGKFRHAASNLSHALADREYLLGAFSSADIVVGSVLMWAASMGLLTDFPALDAYLNRLKARPAWKRSVAD